MTDEEENSFKNEARLLQQSLVLAQMQQKRHANAINDRKKMEAMLDDQIRKHVEEINRLSAESAAAMRTMPQVCPQSILAEAPGVDEELASIIMSGEPIPDAIARLSEEHRLLCLRNT